MPALVVAALVRGLPLSVVLPVPVLPVPVVLPVSPVLLAFLLLALHHHLATQVVFLLHLAVAGAKLILSENAVDVGLYDLLSVQSSELLVVGVVLGDRTQLGTPVRLLL